MQSMRLSDLEQRSWRTIHRDGLLDILFGFMLLGACISALIGRWDPPDWLRILSLSAIQFGGVFWVIWAKRTYVTPRVGHAKFGARRVRRTRTVRIVLAACVAITILLVVLTSLSSRLGFSIFGDVGAWGAWSVIAAVILVPIAVIAHFLDYPRLLLHGSFFVIVEFFLIIVRLGDVMPYSDVLLYGIASLISYSIGIPIFVRFLRDVSPPTPDAEGDANG